MKFFLVCEDEEEGLLQIQEIGDPAGDIIKNFNKTEEIAKFLKWEKRSRRSQHTQSMVCEDFLYNIGVL